MKIPEDLKPFHKTKTGKPKLDINKGLGTRNKTEARRLMVFKERELIQEILEPLDKLAESLRVDPYVETSTDSRTGEKHRYIVSQDHDLLSHAEEIERLAGREVAQRFYNIASNKLTLIDAIHRFEEYMKRERVAKGEMDAKYLQELIANQRRFVSWYGAADEDVISNLTDLDAQAWLRHLRDKEKWKGQTITKRIVAMKALWEWASDEMHVRLPNGDPLPKIWDGLTKKLSKRPKTPTRPFYAKEVELILDAAPEGSAIGDLFRLGIYTGGRIEEMCSLQVKDLKLDEMNRLIGVMYLKRKPPVRRLLVPVLANEVIQILTNRSTGKNQNDFIFDDITPGKRHGELVRSHNIGKSANRLIARVLGERSDLGVYDVSFHSTRHLFTTCADEVVESDKVLKRLRRDNIPDEWARTYSKASGVEQLNSAMKLITELLDMRRWDMDIALEDMH